MKLVAIIFILFRPFCCDDFCASLSQIVPAEFWTGKFFESIVTCVFEPQSLGFNMADLEVLEKLPEQVGLEQLLVCLSHL